MAQVNIAAEGDPFAEPKGKIEPGSANDPFAEPGEKIVPGSANDPFATPVQAGPVEAIPDDVPLSYKERQNRADAFERALGPIAGFGKGFKRNFDANELGPSEETIEKMRKLGIFPDPATGKPGMLAREDEALVVGLAAAGDFGLRVLMASVGGIGGAVAATAGKAGLPEPERLGREISGEIERRMISGDMAVRMHPTREAANPIVGQKVGGLPTPADFRNAADNLVALKTLEPAPGGQVRLYEGYGGKFTRERPEGASGRFVDVLEGNLIKYEKDGVITLPEEVAAKARLPDSRAIEAKLRHLWETMGIHPVELANDAVVDGFVRNEITQGTVHPGEKVPIEAWIENADPTLPKTAKPEDAAAAKALEEGKHFVETTPTAFKDATKYDRGEEVAADRFGRTGTIHTTETPFTEGGTKGKFIATVVGDNGESGTLATTGQFVKQSELVKPAFFDTAEEAAEAARDALSIKQPLQPVGAAVTGPMPSLTAQPQVARGRLVEAASDALSQFLGLGRNIQFALDPMATGSKASMALAKQTINAVRRIRWEHAQMDAALHNDPGLAAARARIKKETGVTETREQQFTRMWNAADEESVAVQEQKLKLEKAGVEGPPEPPKQLGLVTLEPEERAFVERLHADAQHAWLDAVNAGMVEGSGLPAYTPRMVLNVAAAQEHLGPVSLNELGRNAFKRVASMRHRKYFMAEETEVAAREAVEREMTRRGATPEAIKKAVEEVQIARNIRALPLATAKLQEATIWHNMIREVEDIGKAVGKQVVATSNPGGWFTIAGNPAFAKWEPVYEKNPITGKMEARVDDAGRVLMVRKPIFMPPEFKGPMRAILDESASQNKLVQGSSTAYGGLMALKGRSMLLILNSPLIHNMVVWGKVVEAVKGREWLGTGLYFRGNRIVNGPKGGRASELIERGLNPMGPRGSFQDIHSIMENPDVLSGYHKSWTGRVTGFVPGLFDPAAGIAVEKGIAKAGNFWHNTLLWDRVRDVQFGLADHLSDYLVAKGADRYSADIMAAHFSNIVVGSIPKEAMSSSAAAVANSLLFSRSFTLGNIATYKQAVMGMPKPLIAMLEKHYGLPIEAAIEGGKVAPAAVQAATKIAQGMARRKAVSMLILSATMYEVGNAVLQHAMNMVFRDSNIPDELKGYARRYKALMEDTKSDWTNIFHLIGRLSPTYDNEPGRQDRFHISYDKDGTAFYGRNPVGKYGEEVIGYPSHPMKMAKAKLNPTLGAFLDILENDKGFGGNKVPIYDENDTSRGADARVAFAVAKHFVMKELPENQIMAAVDLLHGDGDRKLNALRLLAPAFGFTVSKGAPSGQARGEFLQEQQDMKTRFGINWPEIKKKLTSADPARVEEGVAELHALRIPARMERGLRRNADNPAGALRGRMLHDFYQTATPEQIRRFESALDRAYPPPPPPAPEAPPRIFSPQSHIEGAPIALPGPRG